MNPVHTPPASRAAVRPPASEPQPGSEGAGGFAQLMALQAPAEAPPPAARSDEARQARARQAVRPPTRAAQGDAPRDPPDVSKTPPEPAAARSREDEAAPLDPALAQWLQALHRPETPAGSASPEAADATAAAALGGTRKSHGLPFARPGAEPADALEPGGAARPAGHDPKAARSNDKAADKGTRESLLPAEAASGERRAAEPAAAAEPPPSAAAPLAASGSFALPAGFEPVSGAGAGGTGPTAIDAPLLAVPVPVPLESPEFAQAFGLEISVLARDGVQQAELHLNPAEMGPVSVQIVLDGEKARIDFGAQAAATRAVIESSLPELAAALRDAGLTLAGGGVSQHAGARDDGRGDGHGDGHDRGRDDPASSGSRQRGAEAVAAPARAPLRSRAGPGGVDLYA